MIEALTVFATHFIGIFNAGGENLMGLVTGIIPTLLILLTFVNMLTKLIGEERVMNFAQKCTRFVITRYTILPIMGCLLLSDPMVFSLGRFLNEKHKAAYYDATMSFLHPPLGLFPHVEPAEIFLYMGIATGITGLGLNANILAIWYLLTGILVVTMRGIVTERVYAILAARREKAGGR
jgi:PTS system glucitol/sorbitol-specific IIC component